MTENVDVLIENASEVVTLQGSKVPRRKEEMNELAVIKNASIAIKDGKIIDVGKCNGYSAKRVIDASGKTIIPGFVDSHTHLVFSGSREFELELKLKGFSYTQIKEMGGGIGYTVKRTREASVEELMKEALKRLDTMLAYGTTTCEAKSGYGLNTETEIKILEAYNGLNKKHPVGIVPTFLGAHAVPEEYKGREEEYIDLVVNEMIPVVTKKNLARFCDVFCEKGFFTREQSKRILLEGKKHGLIPKVHADELTNCGGAQLASEVEAVSADHLLEVSEEGISEMAKKGVIAVLLPATVFSLMKKDYAPARELIDADVPVALATDLNPNCYTENMQFVIQLACFYMKMTPAEALTASTINAAHAIGEADRVGSLEVGKQADVLILDCPSHKFIPYHFGVNLVKMVVKKGVVIHST
ncbi:MAG TPA: imidazolonepropionase [Thermoplasmatales archaeon]|nr:imidazolonepropionase [Thermoplasmatales archaeon]